MCVVKKAGFLCVLLLGLVSCSSHYSSNAEQGYLKSRNGPDLVVPSPLSKANVSYFYNLPPQTQDARVSIRPPMV